MLVPVMPCPWIVARSPLATTVLSASSKSFRNISGLMCCLTLKRTTTTAGWMTSYMFQLKPISVTLPTATPRSLTTDPTESPSTLSGTYVSSVYVGSNALRMPKRNSAPNRIATPTTTKMPIRS